MADNVVEVLVKSRDQAKPDITDLKARLAELGKMVETARADVDDADAAAKLDKLRAQLIELDHKTANPKISMSGAVRAESALHGIEDALHKLGDTSADSGEQSGRSWGSRFSSAASKGLQDLGSRMGSDGDLSEGSKRSGEESGGFFASSFVQTVLGGKKSVIVGGVASVLAALPALGAVAGVGLVAGLGGMIASKIPGVASQFKAFGTQVMGTLENSVKPMVPFITSALKQVSGFVKSIGPELSGLFKAVGPMLQPLIGGFEGLIKGLLPGLSAVLKAAMPAVQAFASVLGSLGKDLGGTFAAFAPAVKASAVVMKALFDVIGGLLPVIAKVASSLAGTLGPVISSIAGMFKGLAPVISLVGHVVGEFAQAFLVNLGGGLQAVIGLFKAIEPALGKLAGALSKVFNLMNNRGVFNDLEDAVEQLVGPLGKLITALVSGLVPVLPALVSLLAAAANAFQAGLVSAVTALVNALVPLVPVISKIAVVITDMLASGIAKLTPLLTAFAPSIVAIVVGMKAWAAVTGLVEGALKLLGVLTEETAEKITAMTIVEKLQAVWEGVVAAATKAWSIAQAVLDAVMDANPFVLIGIALIALVAGIVEVVKHWQLFEDAAKTVFKAVTEAVSTAIDWIKGHWPLLLAILTGPIGLATLYIAEHWKQILTGAEDMVHDVTSFFTKLGSTLRSIVDGIARDMFNGGVRIIQFLANGIRSAVGDVEHAVSSIVDDIKSFLPFSPAKKGPLSGGGSPQRSGQQIAALLAKGMISGTGGVREAANRLAASAAISPGAHAYAGAYAGAAAAGAAGGTVRVELDFGGGNDQAIMTALGKAIRVRGGNVQRVLGHLWRGTASHEDDDRRGVRRRRAGRPGHHPCCPAQGLAGREGLRGRDGPAASRHGTAEPPVRRARRPRHRPGALAAAQAGRARRPDRGRVVTAGLPPA